MKTTVAYHFGEVKEEDKYLQITKFKDGYMVEEKGVSFEPIEVFSKLQRKRFESDPSLLRIDIMEPGCTPIALRREE